jgi:ribosomal-protein-alanine N-acetyltransferase
MAQLAPHIDFLPLRETDVPCVVAAEARIHAFPWTAGNFIDSLRSGYDGWIGHEHARLAAYAVTMAVVDETHLLNISVLPELQGRGIGGIMLAHLLDRACQRDHRRFLLEVRASNTSAQGFYRRHGFVEIGRRRGYYPAHGGREDALVMARDIAAAISVAA